MLMFAVNNKFALDKSFIVLLLILKVLLLIDLFVIIVYK